MATATTTQVRPGRRISRPASIAGLLTLFAVIAAAAMLGRPLAAADFDNFEAFAAARNEAWVFSLVTGLAIGASYVLAGIATCWLVVGRGAPLATAGAVLTGIGGLLFASGFFALGVASWFASADVPGGADHFEYVQDNAMRAFGPQAAGFLLSVLGFLLLSAALWRSQEVPRWLPIAIPVAMVAMVGSGTGRTYDVMHAVFMSTLVALGWFLWMDARGEPRSGTGE